MRNRAEGSQGRLATNKCIAWGAGIGIIFGATVGNPGIGLVLGAGVGLMLGSTSDPPAS